MFIICFRGKFFQILWSFLRHSPDSQKNDYLMPYSINVFLMTYSSFIFICVDTSGQRFLITYSPLIFIYMGCPAQQLKINHKYTTIKQWLRTKLSQFRNDPLNQRFFNDVFIAYFYMVFVSVLVLNQRFLMT